MRLIKWILSLCGYKLSYLYEIMFEYYDRRMVFIRIPYHVKGQFEFDYHVKGWDNVQKAKSHIFSKDDMKKYDIYVSHRQLLKTRIVKK